LGGSDVNVLAASFVLEGDLGGALWWLLPSESAERLGQRLLRRPGVKGPLASSTDAAIAEAANIVASACCSSLGSMLKAKVLPSTPRMVRTSVEGLVAGGPGAPETVVVAGFVSTNAPTFSGTLVVLWPTAVAQAILGRLGV
jgi:chemotaxis protein CheC